MHRSSGRQRSSIAKLQQKLGDCILLTQRTSPHASTADQAPRSASFMERADLVCPCAQNASLSGDRLSAEVLKLMTLHGQNRCRSQQICLRAPTSRLGSPPELCHVAVVSSVIHKNGTSCERSDGPRCSTAGKLTVLRYNGHRRWQKEISCASARRARCKSLGVLEVQLRD